MDLKETSPTIKNNGTSTVKKHSTITSPLKSQKSSIMSERMAKSPNQNIKKGEFMQLDRQNIIPVKRGKPL